MLILVNELHDLYSDDNTRSLVQGYRYRVYAQATGKIDSRTGYRVEADYDLSNSVRYDTFLVDTGKLTSQNGMAHRDRNEYSLMGRLDRTWGQWKGVGVARVSHNDFTGVEFAPHLSLNYAIDGHNSLKLSYAEGYRVPTLFETHFTAGTVQSNPNLSTEKSRTVELGYVTSRGPVFIQASGWLANYDDRIFRDKLNSETTRYENAGDFTATGLELELNYNDPNIMNAFLNINYLYGTDGDDPGTGRYNFRYIPKVSFTAGFSKDWNRWTLSALMNFVGETEGETSEIESSTVIDLSLSRQHRLWGWPVLHRFGIKNVTDEETFFPEFARNNINSVPWKNGRRFGYDLTVNFR